MKKQSIKSRLVMAALMITMSGTIFGVNAGGCDPTVRDAVLTGLNTSTTSLLTTLVNAFFLSLGDNNEDGQLTTVRADVQPLDFYT